MKWIDVNIEKPKALKTILLCTDLGYVTQGYLSGLKTRDGLDIWIETYVGNQFHNVTHWPELPEPPKK